MSIFSPRIHSQSHNPNNNNELSLIAESPRKVITGKRDKDEYGIFGNCYSQPQDFVDLLCKKDSGTFYQNNTPEHEIGQLTVDIVLSALNVLPKVKAWQTPHNSDADVKWKWDVIIEHEGYLYPVQIKSGLDAIEECQEKFDDNLEAEEDKLDSKKDKIENDYDNYIERYMQHNRLTSRKDANIVAKIKQRDKEIEKLNILLKNFKKAKPLYIWTARDEDTIKDLVGVFSKLFSVRGDVLELQTQAVKSYQNKYKTLEEILVEAEQEKLTRVDEIVGLIQKYLTVCNEYLTENDLINRDNNKPKRLEDILVLKKTNELLNLAETMLGYYKKSIKLAQNSHDDKLVAQDNPQLIKSYKIKFKEKVLKVIKSEKDKATGLISLQFSDFFKEKYEKNQETDIENLIKLLPSDVQKIVRNIYIQYIAPNSLMECLNNLQEFDNNSSCSQPEILGEIKNNITYIVEQEVEVKSKRMAELDDFNYLL
jgi:hypothetical protein